MKLFTLQQLSQLIANGQKAAINPEFDPFPVVKLFTPDAGCTWLLAWIDTEDPELAFGLCDLGLGFPELGLVHLGEIGNLRGRLGLPVERDRHFEADRPLSAYAEDAYKAERVCV